VLGNVYFLSTLTPAPRLMHDKKLPGCFVSDDFFKKIISESVEDHIERAAQQVAMYKSLGAAGIDLGGVENYQTFIKILKRAAEIGDGWQACKDNLCWPAKESWYLYYETGEKVELSRPKRKFRQKNFDFMHDHIINPESTVGKCLKSTMKVCGMDKAKGFCYSAFNGIEKPIKYWLFECEECGDCYLPENFSYCTIGGCEKGLDNAPCGDSTEDGYCCNNLERICIGEYIYKAAAATEGGLEKLKATSNKPRMPELAHSASIVNYLLSKDHTVKCPIINIGEMVHASIPNTGEVMKSLHKLDNWDSADSRELEYIHSLIDQQARDGADYIAINLDAFGEDDPQLTVELMKKYVRLVRKWSHGVPACIDSSDDNVLKAGLAEWYNTQQKVAMPLINSIKENTIDEIMPLKKDYKFKFIGLLVADEKQVTSDDPIGELFKIAEKIFEAAVNRYGFKPDEIFFDTTVFPLAIDMPMIPGQSGFTYRAFETIKRIKTHPHMKDCHCSLGVTNSVRDLPGRKIGVARAYVEVAMRYGLDAGIVNPSHKFGLKPADPELVKLVEAFAKIDGDSENLNEAMKLMGEFCSNNRKAVK
jgi:5-methyltetrahydrofolate corrinoid/iron sulfur protein methyltransferase